MGRDLPDDIGQLLEYVSRVYDYRINEQGPVANGVFWKDADGQILRLELLLQAVDQEDLKGPITVNDLGCGYGALFDLLVDEPMLQGGKYFGYDIAADMIATAKAKHCDPRATFIVSPVATEVADYSFVSGTYNMSMGAHRALWTHYIKTSIEQLWKKTAKVLAYNLLDEASTHQLDDLFYADRRTFLEHALTLSPDVEIIDDYPLDEFTIIIKRT
ncbi:MAG TPA: class I SAM-dependent methyltransferase [Magnetovibrio sp.]